MSNPEDLFDLCEKRREILGTDGHMLVTGGPGAGKTTIALLKARRVVLRGLRNGQSVLFLSFSNAAVRRIADSAIDLLAGDIGKQVEIKTYHSFAWDILRAHGYLISSRRRLEIVPAQDADVRRAGLSDEEWEGEQARLFTDDGLVTYDQFAPRAAALLGRGVRLREMYGAAFPLILLDEFQDTDEAQWAVVKALRTFSTLVALGDTGQRIYDWRPGVHEDRLDQFSDELGATIFDFGTENNRSPTTGIGGFGRALLDPEAEIPDCDEVVIGHFSPYQFGLYVKLSAKHALREARKRVKNRDINVAIAGRSRSIVRIISDALSQSQNARGKTHGPVVHDVLIDQSQVLLASRVTGFLLEAHTYDDTERLAKTVELIADMHRSGGKATHIATGDRLTKWATKVRQGNPPRTKLVVAVHDLLGELTNSVMSGSPTADWIFIRRRIEASDVGDLSRVAEFVRFLRILRRGSGIEDNLSELWRRQGSYRGAMQAVEDAILREQLIDNSRPPAACTVMTMHQLKAREYDSIVLIEDQHRRFLGRDEAPPYMETRRLLQMAVTRARHYAVIVSPKRNSTLSLLI